MNKNIKEIKLKHYNCNGIIKQKQEFIHKIENRKIEVILLTKT